jgi:hypothetical protein
MNDWISLLQAECWPCRSLMGEVVHRTLVVSLRMPARSKSLGMI